MSHQSAPALILVFYVQNVKVYCKSSNIRCANEIGCHFFVFGTEVNWSLDIQALCYWTKVGTEDGVPICAEGYPDGGWNEDEDFNLFALARK